MNSRDLLKLSAGALGAVIFGPFLGPVQGRAATAVAKAAPAGPWRMIAWREQEFTDELGRRCESWVDQTGFCGIFQDQETLELRRHAVRLDQPADRAEAKRLLRVWGENLNLNWPPEIWRRATQTVEVRGEHGELVGWHHDAPWG